MTLALLTDLRIWADRFQRSLNGAPGGQAVSRLVPLLDSADRRELSAEVRALSTLIDSTLIDYLRRPDARDIAA